MIVDIKDSILDDVHELAKDIRSKDRQEAINLGLDPAEGLYYAYTHSIYRKTAFVNNDIAAMWGIGGDLFGDLGRPYLITGPAVEIISPFQFSKIYKKEVQSMRTFFPLLENYVDASYEGAIRMLKIAGFELTGPLDLGPQNKPFYKFYMRGNV